MRERAAIFFNHKAIAAKKTAASMCKGANVLWVMLESGGMLESGVMLGVMLEVMFGVMLGVSVTTCQKFQLIVSRPDFAVPLPTGAERDVTTTHPHTRTTRLHHRPTPACCCLLLLHPHKNVRAQCFGSTCEDCHSNHVATLA
jgi:hypothetical protein